MNKNDLKKIAYELNIELKGDIKAFIYIACKKFLENKNIFDKDLWLRDFLKFYDEVKEVKITQNIDEPEEICWLYQYFISDEKARVFKNLQNNIKAEKEDIPYATQLFTPDWIVKYLVQNSLGRFIDNKENFEYYVKVKNKDIVENKKLEEIKILDSCIGTGNILIYCFDIIFEAYINKGYSKDKAILNIFTKNLYGTDIDENVVQISKMVLIFKALEFDKNIFDKDYLKDMNIISIKNSKNLNKNKYGEIVDYFENADEVGSLIKTRKIKLPKKDGKIDEFIKQYEILNEKYDVVVTNPPYMGKKNINKALSEFLKKEYPKTKSELYSSFIEKCLDFTKESGYLAMITIHSWMFISSFKDLRKKVLRNGTLINMLHSGAYTFSDLSSFNALATSFVLKKEKLDIQTLFIRLSEYYNLQEKIDNFKNQKNYYYLNQNRFFEIPNQPFIYWISENIRNCFKNNKRLEEFYSPKQGLATGNNKEFVKFWYEVPFNEISWTSRNTNEFFETKKVYAPFNKGGNFRKWYGNFEYVIKFDKDNYEKLLNQGNHLPSRKYYFEKGIVWSLFGFENFGVRYKDYGYVFDVSGSSMFPNEEDLYYVIGFLCSNCCFKFLSCLAPTVNFQVGNIASLPFKIIYDKNIRDRIDELVKENINICKEEWGFYETNVEFEVFPMLKKSIKSDKLEKSLENFEAYYNKLRDTLRKNEEELNKIYSKIFEVDEIDFKVNDRDLTLKPFSKSDFIKLLLSYSVGCSVGRFDYKLEKVNFDKTKYEIDSLEITKFFEKFLIDVFEKDNLKENIEFIEKTLKIKSIEDYYKKDFIKNHKKQYQNRPIYFLK